MADEAAKAREQARLRENAKFAAQARALRQQQEANNAKIAKVKAREAKRQAAKKKK